MSANRKIDWRRWAAWALLPFILYAMMRWFEHRQVYIPMRAMHVTGEALGRMWEDVYFETGDGVRLNGWYFPAAESSERRHLAVLICHGNAGNISHRVDLYELLCELGLNVFAFDYRGYGRSAGRPSEAGTYMDTIAAYDWLRARGFLPANIMVFGESLGGAMAAELALRRPVGAVVLQSTFTSIPALGAELFPFLPVRWICSIQYDTLSKLPDIRVPLLVMHSREDSIIAYEHAEQNFAAANEPKVFWEIGGDHNDSLLERAGEFRAGIEQLLALLSSAGPAVLQP